ncbi:response regulator [Candidatus Woesearchaeota archaeon]|nr:response regulator [Candidatus Woesearchaeota archaeon]
MKKLEILVIEDNLEHLEDARKAAEKMVEEGIPVNFNYATSYVEVKKIQEEMNIDCIVTDVFFPYDTPAIDNEEIKQKCEALLEPIIDCFRGDLRERYDLQTEEWVNAADNWISGKEMHPTGIVVVDEALANNISIVMCTDTYHHGYKTEIINQYAGQVKVTLIDGNPEGDEYTSSVDHKDWDLAYDSVIKDAVKMDVIGKSDPEDFNWPSKEQGIEVRSKLKDDYKFSEERLEKHYEISSICLEL